MNYLCKFYCGGEYIFLCIYDVSAGECIHELAESVEAAAGGALQNAQDYTEVRPCLAS
ncbi:MAG: hypothetical protein [Bacteriophage sp.]|nr:MAG: hypothetical protein [Bacteriophage sp.]